MLLILLTKHSQDLGLSCQLVESACASADLVLILGSVHHHRTMTTTEIKIAIAKCSTLNALERLVRKNHQVLDVVFDVCDYWVYEALVLRIEGE